MSSLTGDGMKEFFDAVDDAKEEYLRYVFLLHFSPEFSRFLFSLSSFASVWMSCCEVGGLVGVDVRFLVDPSRAMLARDSHWSGVM